MKDVAILTKYYKNYNHGGMLQGYALHKAITDLGYTCDLISYDVNQNPNPVYCNVLQQCKQYGSKLATKKMMEKLVGKCNFLIKDTLNERIHLFDEFMDLVDAGTELYDDSNSNKLNSRYRVFVSSSDQVWNKFIFLKFLYH